MWVLLCAKRNRKTDVCQDICGSPDLHLSRYDRQKEVLRYSVVITSSDAAAWQISCSRSNPWPRRQNVSNQRLALQYPTSDNPGSAEATARNQRFDNSALPRTTLFLHSYYRENRLLD